MKSKSARRARERGYQPPAALPFRQRRGILERRLRVGWFWLAGATFMTFVSLLSIGTGEVIHLSRRGRYAPAILVEEQPERYYEYLGFYAIVAIVAWLFSFYRFRKGSWFNPI